MVRTSHEARKIVVFYYKQLGEPDSSTSSRTGDEADGVCWREYEGGVRESALGTAGESDSIGTGEFVDTAPRVPW